MILQIKDRNLYPGKVIVPQLKEVILHKIQLINTTDSMQVIIESDNFNLYLDNTDLPRGKIHELNFNNEKIKRLKIVNYLNNNILVHYSLPYMEKVKSSVKIRKIKRIKI